MLKSVGMMKFPTLHGKSCHPFMFQTIKQIFIAAPPNLATMGHHGPSIRPAAPSSFHPSEPSSQRFALGAVDRSIMGPFRTSPFRAQRRSFYGITPNGTPPKPNNGSNKKKPISWGKTVMVFNPPHVGWNQSARSVQQ